MKYLCALLVGCCLIGGCQSTPATPLKAKVASDTHVNSRKDVQPLSVIETRLNRLLLKLLETEQAVGVGVVIIREGTLVWQGYYGEQELGIPASSAMRSSMPPLAG